MCLRFGSDPRRDFLSRETPRQTQAPVAEPPALTAMRRESGQFAVAGRRNCVFGRTGERAKVAE
jgi:hypothetical protein